MRGYLNQTPPAPYYAQLQARQEVGIAGAEEEVERVRRIVPDVAVLEHARAQEGAVATVAGPPTEVSEHFVLNLDEPIRHPYVEIRDSRREHRLITLIEIVSPSNKRPGADREAYLRKRGEVLATEASLIELDLLRGGERLWISPGSLRSTASHPSRGHDCLSPTCRALRGWLRSMVFHHH